MSLMSRPFVSGRSKPEESACQGQMRLVDHPAVERDRSGVRVFGENCDNFPRPGEFRLCGGKRAVDRRDLGRMDRHLGGKARALRGGAFGGEPCLVLEVGVDRVDRQDIGGRRAQQAERPRQTVNVVICSV